MVARMGRWQPQPTRRGRQRPAGAPPAAAGVPVGTGIEATIDSWRRGVCKGRGVGYTNGNIACEAKMMITIPDIFEQYLPK